MIQMSGYYWPIGAREKDVAHSLNHVLSLDWAIRRCRALGRCGTAVQAGGNMGLWPEKMSQYFGRVITFEPDAISRECLTANLRRDPLKCQNVEIRSEALGMIKGLCDIAHKSIGSHTVVEDGRTVRVVTLDSLELGSLDLLQLDIEGYEYHALKGGWETVKRFHPLIQLEMRGFTTNYRVEATALINLLSSEGYKAVSRQAGCDVVFERV